MRKYIYFKRYRMEADLRRPPFALIDSNGDIRFSILPEGFRWVPWRDSLLAAHAEVKALSFQDETDAIIFKSLASFGGCRDLMYAIRDRHGFCPQATWLISSTELPRIEAATGLAGDCVGTVQGVIDSDGYGGIQNIGVVSEFRGRGLGRSLLLKAVAGFQAAGAKKAYLEVTSSNLAAVRMYRSLGFRCTNTIYRAVEVPQPVAVGL
jgi:hypothetical protein